MKHIYVSGLGVVSAAGRDVCSNVASMKCGQSSLSPVLRFHTAVKVPVGEIPDTDIDLKAELGICADGIMSRTALLGLKAVREAVEDCARRVGSLKGRRIAFISGTSVGGMDLSEVFWENNMGDLSRGDVELLKMHSPGAVTSAMAEYITAFTGELAFVTTISTACSAAGNAIMTGARMLRCGMADVVIAGGTDALCRFTLNGFNSLRILDEDVCRPFDDSRSGLNLGEGAGYLILTGIEDNAYCTLSGWGNANEAYHQTSSTPEGIGPGLAMSSALTMAGLHPEGIGFINTHGTGTQVNDLAESNAMLRVFGGEVPPFSSLKPYVGHTLGASEGIEAALVCKALSNGDMSFMGSTGFSAPIKETGLVPYGGGPMDVPANVLSSAFGFSGNCVSLIFSRL